MKNHSKTIWLIAGLLLTGLCHQASAVLIYDNSVNDLRIRFNPGRSEVGDEIILAGTQRQLQQFDFEYWGTNTAGGASFAGTVQARVKFYRNDGPLFNGFATPGTVFYDSGLFTISATPRSTLIFTPPVDFPAGGLFIPVDRMTWSVQFTNTSLLDEAGVDLYSPPVVGQNFPDYWERDLISGAWALKQSTGATPPINFAARFNATTAVPETTGIGICFMSFLSLLAFGRLTRPRRQ